MESENILKQKQKLQVSDILKEAVMIYVRNLYFIIFTFLISLPLFFIMVYFEIQLQELVETFSIVNTPEDVHYGYFNSMLDRMNKDYNYLKLIQVGLIYIFPLQILEFGSAIVTIDLASKLNSQQEKKMTLKEMFEKPLDSTKLRGSFLTFIYVVFLTTTHLLGLLWIVINYHILKDLGFVVFSVICSFLFAKVLMMYLEWSSMWNMSIVISILEGIYGIDALALSVNFSRGCLRKGFFLMLIFFAWRQLLRLSCYCIGGYEQGNGTFLQVGLYSVVIPLKWVVFMIYFNDCKERYLVKKMDVESGKDVRVPQK